MRNVVVFGKGGSYSVEQTIRATGKWPEYTWRLPKRIQRMTVKCAAHHLEFMPSAVEYDEFMRFRLKRDGEANYAPLTVTLLHNEFTQAKADRVIWHGYSLHEGSAFNEILSECLA